MQELSHQHARPPPPGRPALESSRPDSATRCLRPGLPAAQGSRLGGPETRSTASRGALDSESDTGRGHCPRPSRSWAWAQSNSHFLKRGCRPTQIRSPLNYYKRVYSAATRGFNRLFLALIEPQLRGPVRNAPAFRRSAMQKTNSRFVLAGEPRLSPIFEYFDLRSISGSS